MLTDIEITQAHQALPITEIANTAGLLPDEIDPYGKYKAKINEAAFTRLKDKQDGKLVLVTAINPTPAGEGKTTTSVGLSQGFAKIGKNAMLALREPSLGPVFGMKGGAAGGGYSQVVPMEDINLHFTGDMHAITSANNLLCALIDNHICHGNVLGIDPRTITTRRCLDMNDRALRNVVVGLGGKINGIPREDGFVITVATEIMAILCLATDLDDLKERFGNIHIGYSFTGEPIFARDLSAQGAMTALMKDAINPNLVQTLEGTPAIIHGGPFANIAHGCNSVRATKLALKLGDYCITEAGFGSDLGAEKFLDIKCRVAGLSPDCIVLVATVRALKYNGEGELYKGIVNLERHIENLKKYSVPVVVAVNVFGTDTEEELSYIENKCASLGAEFARSEVFAKGGNGGTVLAEKVAAACEKPANFAMLYPESLTIEEKIETIVKKIYGGSGVEYFPAAKKSLAEIKALGGDKLPVCIAKTQYSLSDDPKLLGSPKGFIVDIRDLKINSGAGFVVAYAGAIMTMPGLPKAPAASSIDVNNDKISGLF